MLLREGGRQSRKRRRLGRCFAFTLMIAYAGSVCVAPCAFASSAHQYEKSFGPDGTEGTQFEVPGAVAVDQETHNVYVADLGVGTVSKFDEGGAPVEFTAGPGSGSNDISGFSFSAEEAFSQIGVNSTSHDFYVADIGTGSIKAFEGDGEEVEFTAGPGVGSNEIVGFGLVTGVAVDVNGDIYVSDFFSGVHVFASSGEEIVSFPVGEPCNVAVDSTGAVYIAPYIFGGRAVTKFAPSEFPVTSATVYSQVAAIDPNRAYGLSVDPANDELYVDEHTGITQFEEDGDPIGSFAETGAGALTASEGVAVDGFTENVYASDTGGERQVAIFVPPPPNPPTVGSLSASNITASSVDLQAVVDPEFFGTHYRFQYVTQAQFEATGFSGATETPEGDLGSSGEPRSARAHVGGLMPGTTYRFRVVAKNVNGETSSAEPAGTFSTFSGSPPGLPDARAYEMVSPSRKSGEVFAPEPGHDLGGSCAECLPGINSTQLMPMQSALDGGAVVYNGQPFSGGLAAGTNEYLSNRTPGGWGTQSLTSPLFFQGQGRGEGYTEFSPDLSRGVLYQVEPTLSPEAPTSEGKSYANLYLWQGGALRPLITKKPEHRAPGDFEAGGNKFKMVYSGANSGTAMVPAFEHLVFEANDALTSADPPNAPEAPEIEMGQGCTEVGESCNLYEWVDGQLRLINVLPGNTEAASKAVIGSGRLLVDHPGLQAPDVDHAISADGSRIFWSEEGTGQVYVRIDGKETLEIPGPGLCKEGVLLEERACFLVASADGSEVLLSDGQIYELNEAGTAYEPAIDLSKGQGGFTGILGAGDDLSRVYFVDTAALTEESEENGNEEHAEVGKRNLYVGEEGVTTFIGILHGSDNEVGSNERFGVWKASPQNRTAQVSRDGVYLAFMSKAPLTGYNNARSGGGECRLNQGPSCFEVFAYNADTKSLSCASCNPTGQRPLGQSNLSLINGIAGFPPFPQPGNLSSEGGGRVFFESQDILSPQDTNGSIQDVYEWEPNGTKTNGLVTCDRPSGCIFLISSGHNANDSMFVDSTPTGNDAFLVTRERLLPRDKDDLLDLYDARVLGGFPEETAPPCGGAPCRGPSSSSPPLTGVGSEEFSGPPNPVGHHKKKHRKHHKKKHRKHHHGRAAKHNPGGSR